MAEKRSPSGTGNTKLPLHQYRNLDGHKVYETEEKNAKRSSLINRGELDPDDAEEEFQDNLKEFGGFEED